MDILLENFKYLTTKPKNVEQLKKLVLQLAVQGKLTAQWRMENPDVESASVLLEKILADKEIQIGEKKIKKGKVTFKNSRERNSF
jgi:type I restriction enzyme, S subunit